MPAGNASHTDMSAAHSLCWSCRQEIDSGPFCKHCVKLQPVGLLGSYFDLFGIEKSFNINQEELKKLFFELSRKFHPDFYSDRSEEERIVARNNSAYLNAALKVLSDPLQRAEYLLSLTTGSFTSSPAPPQELFEKILQIGELLDNPSFSKDQRKTLARAGEDFRIRQLELTNALDDLFESLLKSEKEVKGEIVSKLDDIKYLRTIIARIDKILAERNKNGQ
jgi:molecular chaperone HscB